MGNVVNINCVGHSGLIYFKSPRYGWLMLIYFLIIMWFYGLQVIGEYSNRVDDISSTTEIIFSISSDIISFLFFLAFLAGVTSIVLDKIRRKDIYLITDNQSYFVFLAQYKSEPVDNVIITEITNKVFKSNGSRWDKIDSRYSLLEISDFREMPFRQIFWFNGNKVQMEPWPGSRGLGNKFNSTDRQQDILEIINRLYRHQRKEGLSD